LPLRLQDAQDRLHLAVPHGDLSSGSARRGEERTEVRLRHLGPGLEVAHPTGQRLSLPLGLVASLTREPRLLASGAELAGALRSPRARDLLALARLDGSRVEQAVLAVDRLQTATGKQG